MTEQPVDVEDAVRVMSFGEDTSDTFLSVLGAIMPHEPGEGYCVRLTVADGVECGVPSQSDVELLSHDAETSALLVRDWDARINGGMGKSYGVSLVDLIGVHIY